MGGWGSQGRAVGEGEGRGGAARALAFVCAHMDGVGRDEDTSSDGQKPEMVACARKGGEWKVGGCKLGVHIAGGWEHLYCGRHMDRGQRVLLRPGSWSCDEVARLPCSGNVAGWICKVLDSR